MDQHAYKNSEDAMNLATLKFEALIEEYYSKVLYHSISKVRDLHTAEEITQETFLKAFVNMKKLNNENAFGPWIFKICNNEIFQNARNSKKNIMIKGVLNEIDSCKKYGTQISPRIEKLYSALSALNEKHQEIISLKYFCEFSITQIKALSGISENIIKSRLYEARKKLSELIDLKSENSGLHDIFTIRRKLIMDRVKLTQTGAYVFPRLSLKTQFELIKLSRTNGKFSEQALSEIGSIDKGGEFVKLCRGKLTFNEMVLIISYCDEETIKRIKWDESEDNQKLIGELTDALKKCSIDGYIVNRVDVMLKTSDVDKTLEWYEKTLGWKGHRGTIMEDGVCCYGCVTLDEKGPIVSGTREFNGFHISLGGQRGHECGILPMATVEGLEKLLSRIKKSGWKNVSEIKNEEWGSKTITVKDFNGYEITFMEWPAQIKNPYKDEQ